MTSAPNYLPFIGIIVRSTLCVDRSLSTLFTIVLQHSTRLSRVTTVAGQHAGGCQKLVLQKLFDLFKTEKAAHNTWSLISWASLHFHFIQLRFPQQSTQIQRLSCNHRWARHNIITARMSSAWVRARVCAPQVGLTKCDDEGDNGVDGGTGWEIKKASER